jgi:tetratricopeptide (TPR) repeat protein
VLVFEPTMSALRTQVHGVAYLMSRWIRLDDLNIDPHLPPQEDWNPTLVGQALGLAALLAVGAWAARRRPWLSFGVLWFFVHLLPGNTLILRWDVANERQLYLAGIGLFVSAGIEWTRFTGDLSRPISRIAASALLAVLAAFTWSRNLDYRSEVALWEDTVRKSPAKARAHNNLGEAYRLAGSPDLARASFRRALELDPGYLLARNNLRGLGPPRAEQVSPGTMAPGSD